MTWGLTLRFNFLKIDSWWDFAAFLEKAKLERAR